jgi:HK97 family phage major capsid protein
MNMEHQVKNLLEEQGRAFEGFKASIEAKLKAEASERKSLELRMNRSSLSGAGSVESEAKQAEFKALASHVRDGAELKSMNVTTGPDGGFTVLPQMTDTLMTRLFEVSPVARLARVVNIGSGDGFEDVRDIADYGAAWVGESDTRSSTTGSDFAKTVIPLCEIYCNVKVTQRLLDDSLFDIGEHVAERIGEKFARAMGTALVTGDSVKKPRGLLDYDISASDDGGRTWGEIQHVLTGVDGGFAASTSSSNPADALVDLQAALKTGYRQSAVWLMNRRTAGVVRKFKDTEGRHIWADSIIEGQPPMLLGHRVELVEDMDDVTTSGTPIAFGDISRAYTVITRPGIKLLRDPYTDKPNVQMYAYMRAGGAVVDFDAVKLLKASAS